MSAEAAASTAINIGDSTVDDHSKGKAVADAVVPPPPPAAAAAAGSRVSPFRRIFTSRTTISSTRAHGGWRRGVFCFDFLVRVFAVGALLAAAIIMGTTEETLPFFTQLFQFHARFDDLPAFTFFVVGNAIAGGYLLISIPFSLLTIVCPRALGLRLLLIIFDTIMVALTTAAASAAAAIVYLAHTGNDKANWVAICLQFNDFCQRTSGAVVASFVAVVLLMALVVLSALALPKY